MEHAYSNFALRIDLYARSFRFFGQFLRFLRRIPSIVFPLAITFFTWEFDFMSADNSTPNMMYYLCLLVIHHPAHEYPKKIFFCRACVVLIMLHLALLNFSCHLSSHSCGKSVMTWSGQNTLMSLHLKHTPSYIF